PSAGGSPSASSSSGPTCATRSTPPRPRAAPGCRRARVTSSPRCRSPATRAPPTRPVPRHPNPPPTTASRSRCTSAYGRSTTPPGAAPASRTCRPAAFSGAVMELAATEPGGVEGLLAKLKDAGSPLHGHLKGVWETAQRDLDRFRKGVESWFDGEMQRLSLLYKRYVRWVV